MVLLMSFRFADRAFNQFNFDHSHFKSPILIFLLQSFPLKFATSSALFNPCSAAIVALTTFLGLLVPKHFVLISLIPANSHTARTAPPAITPVPSLDGLSNTLPAPNSPMISCGIVVPTSGTDIMCF